tara:strand:+ start:1224 stop:1643 length:420 start_codon:yes stop_codon:yes gene_type:complete
MHDTLLLMLNIFPIQFLALLAYFLLRLFVGGVMLYLSTVHIKHYHRLKQDLTLPWFPFSTWNTLLLIGTELSIGLSILLGVYTQLGAILLVILSIKMLFFKKHWQHHSFPSRMTYVLLIGCGLSLFITGAGAFAFDLPI